MLNFLSRLWKRSLDNPAVPLTSPAAYNYLGGPRSSAGVTVDRTTVLGYPVVWRAINLLSKKVGRLPIHVYRHTKDGGREIDYEHPAEVLLARKPSNLYTPITFRTTMTAHALLHGNAFAWIIRDKYAKPIELVILNPEFTAVAMDAGRVVYLHRLGNETRKLMGDSVLHIRGLSHDGLVGYSLLDIAREAFGLGLAAQKYGSVFFKNNGSPGPVVLKWPQGNYNPFKDKEQLAYLREHWNTMHVGLDNAHKPAILAQGGDITTFQIDNETAQFLQTREFEVVQMTNLIGVPASKMGVRNSVSYNSLEMDERAFLKDSVDDWLCTWEQEAACKMLTENQQLRANRFIEFDRRSLEKADPVQENAMLLNDLNGGAITLNEFRAAKNMASAGADGDRYRMPVGVTFADMVGQPDDEQATEEPDAPAESPPGAETEEAEPFNEDPVEQTEIPSPQRTLPLLASVLKRFANRLHKATTAARNRPDWEDWLVSGLEQHRGILHETLAPVTNQPDKYADAFLSSLREELRHTLPEQTDKVFERLNPDEWAERILDGN